MVKQRTFDIQASSLPGTRAPVTSAVSSTNELFSNLVIPALTVLCLQRLCEHSLSCFMLMHSLLCVYIEGILDLIFEEDCLLRVEIVMNVRKTWQQWAEHGHSNPWPSNKPSCTTLSLLYVFLANISQKHLCLKQLPNVELYQAPLKMKPAVLFIGVLDFLIFF